MEIIIGIIAVAFLIGLLTRKKGDGVLDTIGSGCSVIVGIIVIITAILLYMYYSKR